MFENNCGIDTLILSFGGGVVRDLVGFVASTYMRGISCIQIPTCFLSMIDSKFNGNNIENIIQEKNFANASITMPFKEDIHNQLFTLNRNNFSVSNLVLQIGAMNTIIKYENEKYYGENTDWFAIHKLINEKISSVNHYSILFDVNYIPYQTALIKQAKLYHWNIIYAIDMFIEQELQQRQLWTGKADLVA